MSSDYVDMNFCDAYGMHIKALRWERCTVFVVGQNGIIRHVEYVPAGGQARNDDAALAVLKELA